MADNTPGDASDRPLTQSQRSLCRGRRRFLWQITAGTAAVVVRCHKCNAENEPGDRFCGQCGAALAKTRPCPACGELNDPDARFCDNCGAAFEPKA